MSLSRPRRVLRKNLLTAKGAVPASPAVRVTTHIAIRMAHIVPVFLVEDVVRDLVKAAPPEHQTLLEVETHALEEESVL